MSASEGAGSDPADILDVAIIGGGVAGCYAAYRLLCSDKPAIIPGRPETPVRAVAIFEASDRIGGRLYSVRAMPDRFTADASQAEGHGPVAELGGVAFSPVQGNVAGLCAKLGLQTEPAHEFDTYCFEHMRGRRFSFNAYAPAEDTAERRDPSYYPNVVPYFLNDSEKWLQPLEAMCNAFSREMPGSIREILQNLMRTDLGWEKFNCAGEAERSRMVAEARSLILRLREELKTVKHTGQPITHCGFWQILATQLSQEAYAMGTNSDGFVSTSQNWNAYDTAIPFFGDFGLQQPWTKLTHGYQSLPLTLARLAEERGCRIRTGWLAYGIDRPETLGDETVLAIRIQEPDGTLRTQRARSVILAIPQRALSLLAEHSVLADDPQFLADLNTVSGVPASKFFMTFGGTGGDPAWWKAVAVPGDPDNGIKGGLGQSSTDLPIRLVYYLGQQNGVALLLAAFCDSVYLDYWSSQLSGRGAARPGPQGRGALTRVMPLRTDDLPATMVQDALRQLQEMHGCTIPAPRSAVFVNWGADPFGAGWHFWNIGAQSWDVMPRIRRPVAGMNLFVCGEAFSADQGWVEGAINTAERTLGSYFGLARPGWIPADYDLGP